VDERKPLAEPREVAVGVTAAFRQPVQIELELNEIRIRLGDEQLERNRRR